MEHSLSRRILLMEGNLALHEGFRRILSFEGDAEAAACAESSCLAGGFEIDSASHGPEGWTRVQEANRQHGLYALAVVDLDLAGEWDGVETVRRLWDEDPDLPILLCTPRDHATEDRREVIRRLGRVGGFLFLDKPLDPDQVRQMVSAQVDRRLARAEWKEAEGEFRRAVERSREEVEAASRAKSEFMANVGHEIRTPMNAILGFTRLLMNEPLSPDQLERLCHVHDAGTSLLNLINNILDYSKLAAGELKLSTTPFNLETVLAEVLDVTRLPAKEKGLVVRHHTLATVPRRLRGDKTRLRQILVNLVNNAIKFTEHGTIHIHTALDEQTDQTASLRITVTDTGVGIPAERQAVIFESFSQADGSSTRQFAGVGLGLSICKQLVDLMGGQIGFRSDEGQGSSFWLTLTLRKHAADQPTDTAEESAPWSDPTPQENVANPTEGWTGKPHVLVVEDDHLNRTLAEMLLGRIGCLVDLAGDGREALAMLSKGRYDLALVDVKMQESDGWQTIKQFRHQEADTGGHLPIVAVTTREAGGCRQRCLDAGADDYVRKPFSPEMLIGTVRRHLPRLLESGEQESAARSSAGWRGALDRPRSLDDHIQALCKALDGGDFGALESSAAAIKRLPLKTVSKLVADHAMRVQLAARSSNLEQAASAVRRLQEALQERKDPASGADMLSDTLFEEEGTAHEVSSR